MTPIAIAVFDIDGVIRDVGGSYRRAIADTVEHYTNGSCRPTIEDIDNLKREGIWNNDWKASEAMIHRSFERQQQPKPDTLYEEIVDYFQKQYRGPDTEDPEQWTGYIADEPLLMDKAYLQTLAQSGIPYAFFSGATQGSANFVLQRRLSLQSPILIAMEDAPSKPDPTGLMMAVRQVEEQNIEAQTIEAQNVATKNLPVIYAGDTAADMKTIARAKTQFPERQWLAIGILPPHAQQAVTYRASYSEQLKAEGAIVVLDSVQQITAELIAGLLSPTFDKANPD
ncbi:MAG: TIGR01548 family HAD-type hydrolase [Phormidesmis priestleyi]|uniref:TIGR01548 family HAD-type hydrolase n=1 Tax=Phormidesmis priestleyi TaxID=268141 RepID=A0A2W4X1H8_9CYAN|nr:MAG: TIGR01548 family HAD-type hydrolase [Phormidesmis priestleyi]